MYDHTGSEHNANKKDIRYEDTFQHKSIYDWIIDQIYDSRYEKKILCFAVTDQ